MSDYKNMGLAELNSALVACCPIECVIEIRITKYLQFRWIFNDKKCDIWPMTYVIDSLDDDRDVDKMLKDVTRYIDGKTVVHKIIVDDDCGRISVGDNLSLVAHEKEGHYRVEPWISSDMNYVRVVSVESKGIHYHLGVKGELPKYEEANK